MFRGNERRAIFRDDADRRRMLGYLEEMGGLHGVRLYLVCLMPNHVHLLLETPRANLSAFMGQLLTAYAVYFNRRRRRCGHLTQGRYKAQVVQGDDYLLKLSRYIHLNPVHTRATRGLPGPERLPALLAYRWSTFRGYAGLEKRWDWIDYAPTWAMVPAGGAAAAYRRFVEAGPVEEDASFKADYAAGRLAVGCEDFRRQIERMHTRAGGGRRSREDVSLRRELDRRAPDEILRVVAEVYAVERADLLRTRRKSPARAAACWHLMEAGGLTQRAIAGIVGLAGSSAVGYQMRQWKAYRQVPRHTRAEAAIRQRLGSEDQ